MTGRRLPGRRWTALRPEVVAAAIAFGLLLPVLAAPRVVAAFTANVSNGPQTLSAGAWKSYVHTLQNDGTPTYWWRLGEAATDNTVVPQAGGYNGTYLNGHGVQNPGAITGDANTAAKLDEKKEQCLDFGDIFDPIDRTKFSVEFWFQREKATNDVYPRLVSKFDGVGGWEIAVNAPNAATNKNEIYFSRIDSTGTATYTGSGTKIADRTWYHAVATFDGTTMSFYLNGDLTGTASSTGNLPDNSRPLTVGCLGGSQDFLKGLIDEVSLYWDKALTPRQVLSHYYAGLANGLS